MRLSGPLHKMKGVLEDVVCYTMCVGEEALGLRDRIGSQLTIAFQHEIRCTACSHTTSKSFGQGYCYPCFVSSPLVSECILRPELCRAHEGKGRDVAWEEAHHLQPHVVYLSLTAGVKVGVTRETQVPTRWIDQGAVSALIVARCPNRYIAGCMEVLLKQFLSDRTSWRRMLKNQIEACQLKEKACEVRSLFFDLPASEAYRQYWVEAGSEWSLQYPVMRYPERVKTVSFDKVECVSGQLLGIKGQYLLFDLDRVFNVRRHSGYVVTVEGG